jgi:hypothetical protein
LLNSESKAAICAATSPIPRPLVRTRSELSRAPAAPVHYDVPCTFSRSASNQPPSPRRREWAFTRPERTARGDDARSGVAPALTKYVVAWVVKSVVCCGVTQEPKLWSK